MSLHHVETYETHDGKTGFRIKVGDDIIANDARQGYNNRQDALHSLFGIWFGNWDESFLALYNEWQSYAGEGYEVPPEAQEGAPVHIPQKDSGTGEYADDPITAKSKRDEDDPPKPDGITDSSE
jgi:hypothetical protein